MVKLTCSWCGSEFWREDYKYWKRLETGADTFFCSRSCWAKHRFKRKVEWKEDENGCWICTSHNTGEGRYPEMKRDYKTTTVARFLYCEKNGPIEEGGRLIHKCRNPLCINPDHMEVGTQADVVKHRDKGENRWIPSGEKHPRAILTENDVRFIRTSELTTRELVKKYKISAQQIWRIRQRQSWKHID